jgi:outer membrane protein OmpA-like peptidoglycan-associated protein/tetratricopeptide (TPR) repeat protein
MKTYKYTLLFISILVFSFGYSQNGKIKRATKDYDKFAYIKTSEILLEVAEKGFESSNLFQKLGNSFYFNNKMEEATKWYGKLMAMNESVDAEYYFRYAQALKSVENYSESDKWMQKFHDSKPSDLRGKAFSSKINYLSKIEAASRDNVKVKNLDFNSSVSDFGTTQYKDQLIFASSRGGGKIYQWNEQPFLDLYTVTKQEDGTYKNPSELSNVINTKYHESTVSYTPDDKIMYFTRNNYFKKKFGKDDDGTNRLQMFRAYLQDDDSWDDVKPIHFNSNQYSVAHPTVNISGTKVIFASDMPGTTGQSDLYITNINEDGSLGEPENLGAFINTEGQETFPYINSKGDLYFASNSYPGLGGLDVYVIRDFETKMNGSQNYIVENLGKPINSPQDDFAYYENLGTKEGFFTSNREGGKGDDDIYSFVIPDCMQIVEGIVKDKDTQELIPDATVTLFDKNGEDEIAKKVVGNDAAFSFEIDCEREYIIRVSKDTYSSDEERFTTPYTKQELQLELSLDKDEQEVTVGTDLAEVLDIPIIYFDFDKSNIRRDAALELQKVIAVMTKHPNMKVDVRSHTDSRATQTYNDALSNRRNKSTIKYLVEVGGINASRLTGRGYGERELTNRCADGVSCTEEEHQLNRRSEFIIVSMD